MATFSALEKDQILDKLVLIDAIQQTGLGDQFQIHEIPRLCVDSLFMFERLPKISRILTPLTMASFNSAVSNGSLISPQSPDSVLGRVIDPSLVSISLVITCGSLSNRLNKLTFCHNIATP